MGGGRKGAARSLLKAMFGEQQMKALIDIIECALVLKYTTELPSLPSRIVLKYNKRKVG